MATDTTVGQMLVCLAGSWVANYRNPTTETTLCCVAVSTYNNGLFNTPPGEHDQRAKQASSSHRTSFASSSSLYVPLSARGPGPVSARRSLSRLSTPRTELLEQ